MTRPASGRSRRRSAASASTSLSVVPRCCQRPLAGPLDHRAVRQRIAEGHTQLDHVGASVDCRESDVARRRQIGIARSEIDHEPGLRRFVANRIGI